MALSRTQKRNKKKKTERRSKASETRRRQASETRRRQASETRRRHTGSRKIQTAFRDYNKLDKCSICLLGVRPELQEQCHNFHPKCIAQWKASANANRNLCPSCRQPLLSTKSQQPTLATQTDLMAFAREINQKFVDLTVLIDHIGRLDPDYFENAPEFDQWLRGIMIYSNVIMTRVNDGVPDGHPEIALSYLRERTSHLIQMDHLIERLEEDREVLQEVADIRATR